MNSLCAANPGLCGARRGAFRVIIVEPLLQQARGFQQLFLEGSRSSSVKVTLAGFFSFQLIGGFRQAADHIIDDL